MIIFNNKYFEAFWLEKKNIILIPKFGFMPLDRIENIEYSILYYKTLNKSFSFSFDVMLCDNNVNNA